MYMHWQPQASSKHSCRQARLAGVCNIQVKLNSPIDRVNTISEPANIPDLALGRTIVKNLVQNEAPKLAAPSSNSLKLNDDKTANTDRTINGSV